MISLSKYIIENDEVREYFHQEYKNINVEVVPGHWPNFKTKEEVDKWIQFMTKVEKSIHDVFDEKSIEEQFNLKGNKCLLYSKSRFVGVIGPRKATREELRASYLLSQKLVKNGHIVVSGMASGVDSEAHRGAINNNGETIAILSTAQTEPIYPRSNLPLFDSISNTGLVIFPYSVPAKWGQGFGQPQKRLVERDILLAYLCPRIIVVSDDDLITGGSAWALNYANKFGKSIWRVDSKFNFHSNPSYEEKEIWWDMELDLSILD